MDPGKYRWRCELQAPVTTQDAAGQPIDSWIDLGKVWADIRATGGLEAIKAGAATSTVQASIRLRYRTDIDSGMRLIQGSTTYNVLAVLPDFVQKRHVDLVCEVIK